MFSVRYKRYVLATLTLVYTLNYLDQGLISLLLQPIKEDLALSDAQLGLLTGLAFGLFYATLGLPIARWADRGNRPTITSIAIGLWGTTVMLCLFVTSFVQLALARIAAAVGESGCMPSTYSLIGDYFPAPAERAPAMAFYMLANPLSVLVSFVLGGWVNEHFGWRVAFFVVGLPALPIALLVKATIAEPRWRAGYSHVAKRQLPRMVDVLGILWRQRSSRHLTIAIILLFTMAQGLGPWYAAFLIRSHGMSTSELGLWLGLIFGIGGITGTTLGGYIAGRWLASDERYQVRLSAVTIALLLPFLVLFLTLPHRGQALAALVPIFIALTFFLGPTFALMQRLVVDEMRATTMALMMLLANLIGMGLGPQLVGLLSDLLRPGMGQDSLRYAMLIMSLIALWGAYHFWKVGDTIKGDLLAVKTIPCAPHK